MKEKISKIQFIINALMTGKKLKSKDIKNFILEKEGVKVKVQDVASMLARISDPARCDLAYFIQKEHEGNRIIYQMAEDIPGKLTNEQAYGLTLKTGDHKYPMEQAVKDFPELEKHVLERKKETPAEKKKKQKKTAAKKAAKPRKTRTAKVKPAVADVKKAKTSEPDKNEPKETKDLFRDLEALTKKLREMDRKDDVAIKDIDVKVSFRFSTTEE